MSITIGRYTFDGPYFMPGSLEDRSGVYAVHDRRANGNFLLDVGESATVKTRVENHDRANEWKRNCLGTLVFSALYTPNLQQAGRMQVEQELRRQYNPPCGKR